MTVRPILLALTAAALFMGAGADPAAGQVARRTAAGEAAPPAGRQDAEVTTTAAMDDDRAGSSVLRRDQALENARPRGRAQSDDSREQDGRARGGVGQSSVIRRPDPGTGRVQPASPEYTRHPQAAPEMSPGARPADYDPRGFASDPDYGPQKYDPKAQIDVYGGKSRVNGPRPPIELGYPMYAEGPLPDSLNLFGEKNPARPQLLVYGDWRTAVAYIETGAKETGQIATRLNVDIDLKLTATERVHMFMRPLDNNKNGQFTNYEFFGDDRKQGTLIKDGNIETLFFEGDLGAMMAGFTGQYNSYDIPVAAGLVPLLFQNGIWVDDAFVGGAFTIPARNSKWLDISNMDFTFFAGVDRVTSGAIRDPLKANKQDDAGAKIFGVATFIDVMEGYVEAGYGYTQDVRGPGFGFDYHNMTAAFTRRYGGWLSNSVRAIWNFGQTPDRNQRQTADGVLLLVENSLITHLPSTLVPYFNGFIGRDRPQSLVRDFGAGGVLKNTGINFETDGLTGFPKLDDTANDTYGGAIGIQYLFNLDQQLVFEVATNQIIGANNRPGRSAKGDEYAIGARYQIPLSMAWIFRTDVIHAWRSADVDFRGIRFEVRRKF